MEQSGCSGSTACHVILLKWSCALPSLANWHSSQHPVLLCKFAGYLRLAVHCKQPEVLEHGAILLQDSATPHHHHDVQIEHNVGAGRWWHKLPTLQISSRLITGCLRV